jgi:hypothetical protein
MIRGNSIRFLGAYTFSPEKSYFDVLKKIALVTLKTNIFVVYVKEKTYLLKSRIFNIEFYLFYMCHTIS